MSEPWKPRNFQGSICYDPRDELAAWAGTALGEMVAVPVALLQAVVAVRPCSSTIILRNDEDGPLRKPLRLHCRKPEGHAFNHGNGYMDWSEASAERLPIPAAEQVTR